MSSCAEENSFTMVKVDAFTLYVAFNTVPHCNDSTLYEHGIAKFELPDILVTDNGRELINKEKSTPCPLCNIKFKPRTSLAPWTNGIAEDMNRFLQE